MVKSIFFLSPFYFLSQDRIVFVELCQSGFNLQLVPADWLVIPTGDTAEES